MHRTMSKAIVLASCLALSTCLALAVISFVYPSVIEYGHISKPNVAGRLDFFYGHIHVNAGESEWHFDCASNFDADIVSGGGIHWNRTSTFPPRFDAEASIVRPEGATLVEVGIAFPLWIPLAVFAIPPGIWAYRRRKSRKRMHGFPVAPVSEKSAPGTYSGAT